MLARIEAGMCAASCITVVFRAVRTGSPRARSRLSGVLLERTPRRGPRHIQLRPGLIDGRLAGTGLTLTLRP
ncbi:hypothetical protein [Streptomyces sp. NPDC002276]